MKRSTGAGDLFFLSLVGFLWFLGVPPGSATRPRCRLPNPISLISMIFSISHQKWSNIDRFWRKLDEIRPVKAAELVIEFYEVSTTWMNCDSRKKCNCHSCKRRPPDLNDVNQLVNSLQSISNRFQFKMDIFSTKFLFYLNQLRQSWVIPQLKWRKSTSKFISINLK